MKFPSASAAEMLTTIRATLKEADQIVFAWEEGRTPDRLETEQVRYLVERAFVQTLIFLEIVGLPETLKAVQELNEDAKKDYGKTAYAEELYLVWSAKLGHYLDILETRGVAVLPIERVGRLVGRFHRCALNLRKRRLGRNPLTIEDEYDVQYLLEALLSLEFEDVRPEEWGPSYAGSSTRVDFLLKSERLVVEVKKTRSGLTDKKLGQELVEDIAHYRSRPDCDGLFCFVYDPEHLLRNPRGIETDLSKPVDGFSVKVIVAPDT